MPGSIFKEIIMKQEDNTDGQPQAVPAKKRYEKPAFQREQIFETMALSCGKINQTQHNCDNFRKFS